MKQVVDHARPVPVLTTRTQVLAWDSRYRP